MHGLYKDHLLDHYRYPRNAGSLVGAHCNAIAENPSCGDAVTVTIRIESDVLADLRFNARGCVISVAGASLLSEQVIGKPLDAVAAYSLNSMKQLIDIPLGPTRLKCAALPLDALHKALQHYTKTITTQ